MRSVKPISFVSIFGPLGKILLGSGIKGLPCNAETGLAMLLDQSIRVQKSTGYWRKKWEKLKNYLRFSFTLAIIVTVTNLETILKLFFLFWISHICKGIATRKYASWKFKLTESSIFRFWLQFGQLVLTSKGLKRLFVAGWLLISFFAGCSIFTYTWYIRKADFCVFSV